MFPSTAGPPCERALFCHSPFYEGRFFVKPIAAQRQQRLTLARQRPAAILIPFVPEPKTPSPRPSHKGRRSKNENSLFRPGDARAAVGHYVPGSDLHWRGGVRDSKGFRNL